MSSQSQSVKHNRFCFTKSPFMCQSGQDGDCRSTEDVQSGVFVKLKV